jgi:hypothetical protein
LRPPVCEPAHDRHGPAALGFSPRAQPRELHSPKTLISFLFFAFSFSAMPERESRSGHLGRDRYRGKPGCLASSSFSTPSPSLSAKRSIATAADGRRQCDRIWGR